MYVSDILFGLAIVLLGMVILLRERQLLRSQRGQIDMVRNMREALLLMHSQVDRQSTELAMIKAMLLRGGSLSQKDLLHYRNKLLREVVLARDKSEKKMHNTAKHDPTHDPHDNAVTTNTVQGDKPDSSLKTIESEVFPTLFAIDLDTLH